MLLVFVLIAVFVGDAVAKNWCDNPIASKEEAIAVAKHEGIRRGLFEFSELGGSRGFVGKLLEPDCCDAKSQWDWSRFTVTWFVTLDIEQTGVIYVPGVPRYHTFVRITRCRSMAGSGKLRWD